MKPNGEIYNLLLQRDRDLFLHSEEVAYFSILLGNLLGVRDIDTLALSALLHDIGKIYVRDEDIIKDSEIKANQYEAFKLHTILGAAFAIEHYHDKNMALTILYHHENFDGSGYFGLMGYEIPQFSRIIRIADSFSTILRRKNNFNIRNNFDLTDIRNAIKQLVKYEQWYDKLYLKVFVEYFQKDINFF